MEFLIIGSGVGFIAAAIVLRPVVASGRPTSQTIAAIAVAGAVALLSSSVAYATHTEVTSVFHADAADGTWNGYRVFLSSPRHTNSGDKGECGWDENINGRHWNYYAASVNTGSFGALDDRGYDVVVSPNAEDGNYTASINYADSWGADVYVVTHTNAPGTGVCDSPASYLLVMHRTGVSDSVGLKDELLYFLDPATPGGQNNWNCDGLGECLYPDATHRAYVELFFHTNQSAVNWFQGNGSEGSGGVQESWRYGAAVDVHLDYP